MKSIPLRRQRRRAVAIFFIFMLLHQTDRLLVGPLTSLIMADFQLNEVQMGGIITGSLLLGSIFYPIWGFLYDRYARPKLLALASFIWGITTWFSAAAPTPGLFLVSRASTGIDDSSYPGIGSLISDYFPPEQRSRVFGFLQLAIPLGYLAGLLLALNLAPVYGWRMLYIVTGLIGIILAGVILAGVKDQPRGASEPELENMTEFSSMKIDWSDIPALFKIPSLRFFFLQSLIGVLPWQVITFWSFRYLEVERNYTPETISSIMIPAVLLIGAGYFSGGLLGDAAFKLVRPGRLYVSILGILGGAIFLSLALTTPIEEIARFRILLMVTSFFIPLASPNIATSIYDVVLPEVRSTATSIQYFLGNLGSAAAPLLAGAISALASLEQAILIISLAAWSLTALLLAVGTFFFVRDMRAMHQTLAERTRSSLKSA